MISQRLAGQFRTNWKKGWFSDLGILEIHQNKNKIEDSYTVPDRSRINKQKQSNRNEQPTSENRNATQLNNAQENNPEQTLTQEQKGKSRKLKENIKREEDYFTISKKHRMQNG